MALPGTPQRPLPGTYFMTPAPPRFNQPPPPQPPLFRPPQPHSGREPTPPPPRDGTIPPANQAQIIPQPLLPISRAAKTINEVLQRESSFPDLDSYVKRELVLHSLDKIQLIVLQRVFLPTMNFHLQLPTPPGLLSKR